jgi:hypothetical protein
MVDQLGMEPRPPYWTLDPDLRCRLRSGPGPNPNPEVGAAEPGSDQESSTSMAMSRPARSIISLSSA